LRYCQAALAPALLLLLLLVLLLLLLLLLLAPRRLTVLRAALLLVPAGHNQYSKRAKDMAVGRVNRSTSNSVQGSSACNIFCNF
jgi:hypothetical protein